MGNDKTVALAVADRIKQFIDYLGITITQFADNTGIQRPSMSQMLSGRNQKISITTIGKIHERYPRPSLFIGCCMVMARCSCQSRMAPFPQQSNRRLSSRPKMIRVYLLVALRSCRYSMTRVVKIRPRIRANPNMRRKIAQIGL